MSIIRKIAVDAGIFCLRGLCYSAAVMFVLIVLWLYAMLAAGGLHVAAYALDAAFTSTTTDGQCP